MVLITIVNGVYKPTNITGGPHIVSFFFVRSAKKSPQTFHLQATAGDLLPERGFLSRVSTTRRETSPGNIPGLVNVYITMENGIILYIYTIYILVNIYNIHIGYILGAPHCIYNICIVAYVLAKPSGKRLHNELDNHHAINGKTHYFYGHFQ